MRIEHKIGGYMGYGAGWAFFDLFRLGLMYFCGYQQGKENATREIETKTMKNDINRLESKLNKLNKNNDIMNDLRAKLAELNRQNAARRNGN